MKNLKNYTVLKRHHWDRYFVPSFVAAGFAGIVAWQSTGEFRFLSMPLFLVVLRALIRAATPAHGMVVQKLSKSTNPDSVNFIRFLLIWGLVAGAGLTVHHFFHRSLTHPDSVMIVGTVIWVAVLLFEAFLQDRRKFYHAREAADLAAKARGEAGADLCQTD